MEEAYTLANAVYKSNLVKNGILVEARSCLDENQQVFKGIYMHYLAYYVENEVDKTKKDQFRSFILDNAAHVWENALHSDGLINAYWDNSGNLYSSAAQVSGLALFNAAARVQTI